MIMQKNILNYRIIIEPEVDEKTGKTVYTATAPTLGVADWGKTVEEAQRHIKEAIHCHIESLTKHNSPIPSPDSSEYMITTTHIELPTNTHFTFT